MTKMVSFFSFGYIYFDIDVISEFEIQVKMVSALIDSYTSFVS